MEGKWKKSSFFSRTERVQLFYLHECLTQVGSFLDQLPVFFQERAEKQTQVLDEILLIVFPIGVRHFDVSIQWQHLGKQSHKFSLWL